MMNMSNKVLRIIVDLDGTICNLRKKGESYADVLPKEGAIDFLYELKRSGHVIVIHTARNMQTQGHNVGRVMKNVGLITLEWLEKYKVPYDEIYFGKPNGDITIDDRALRLESWKTLTLTDIYKLAKDE